MLWRSLKTKFETDFKNNLDSIKKHLAALESETTLAHRKEMHLFAAESRAGLANDGRDVNNDTEEVRSTFRIFGNLQGAGYILSGCVIENIPMAGTTRL